MGRLATIPTGARKYQIQALWDRQKEVLRLLVMGWENKQIASYLNITPTMVSNIRHSELGKKYLEGLNEVANADALSVQARLRASSHVAVAVLEEVMENEDAKDADRIKAAVSIMDRAGYGATVKAIHKHDHLHLGPKDITEIKSRAKNLGMVIDVGGSVGEQQTTARQAEDVRRALPSPPSSQASSKTEGFEFPSAPSFTEEEKSDPSIPLKTISRIEEEEEYEKAMEQASNGFLEDMDAEVIYKSDAAMRLFEERMEELDALPMIPGVFTSSSEEAEEA